MRSALHPFDQSIALHPNGQGSYTGQAPKAYWNMVGPFGGATAAVTLNAVCQDQRMIGEPLSLTVNFCAPMQDAAFDCRVHCVQTNRSTQHWRVELVQPNAGVERVIVLATVVTGVRRDGWQLQCAQPPGIDAAQGTFRRGSRSGLPWFDRYELRFTGNPMKAEDPQGDLVAWVRDDPVRTLDFCSLTAICDTLFPAILSHRQALVPIATVSMTTYFHCNGARLAAHGDALLNTVSRSQIHTGGFCDASGEVWADQTLVATTQQVMWYRQEQ